MNRHRAAAWAAACVLAGGTIAAASALTAGSAAAATCPAPAATTTGETLTFCYTGGPQYWTVPAGVTQATFTLYGAEGGANQAGTAAGGLGAKVAGTLPVTPGTVLQVNVGQGGAGDGGAGFGGGGPAGNNSGSGGGESDVRSPGADGAYPLADALLVAGGGGGSGIDAVYLNTYQPGGAGGDAGAAGTTGGSGTSVLCGETLDGGGGGGAGTTSGGGSGGGGGGAGTPSGSTCSSIPGPAGTVGSSGAGGAGGAYGGGGGGGGYYGGGGGGAPGQDSADDNTAYDIAAGGGGGGGSSYVGTTGATVADGVPTPDDAPNGEVIISAAAFPVTVTGSQTYGSSSPQFTASYPTVSGVTVTGTVTCGTVNFGTSIDSTLDPGSYPIDASSCSGLSTSTGLPVNYIGGTFTVSQASQAISFTAPSSGTVGQTVTLTATGGGSDIPVTFSVDPSSGTGVCSVLGHTVSYTAAGTCVIDANEAGDTDYAAAPQVQGSIAVQNTAIAATVTGSQVYGSSSPQFTPSYTAPSGVTVSGTVTCGTVNGGTPISGTLTAGESYTIDGSSCSGLTASSGYTISYTGGAFTVSQASQAITGFSLPSTGIVNESVLLSATGGGSGDPVTFTVDSSSASGACDISDGLVNFTGPGDCVVDANQAGDTDYSAAPQVQATVEVESPPAFTADSPPLTAATGTQYSYTFTASGSPAPTFTLNGAPTWLSINSVTGKVTGIPPAGTTSFSYSVTAANGAGSATNTFTVAVTSRADVQAALSCPSSLTAGAAGTCVLTVTNAGPALATDVSAAAVVTGPLTVTGVSDSGSRLGGLLGWSLGSLPSGQSVTLTISVTATRAGTAIVVAADGSANPDPDLLNNLAAAAVQVSRT